MTPSKVKDEGLSLNSSIQLLGFCVFESCVGIFWPSIMKMRSQYIPEEARSTIMNFFRVPLNIFVCIVLYNVRKFISSSSLSGKKLIIWKICFMVLQVDAFPITIMFGMCSIFLFVASILQRRLMVISEKPSMFLFFSLTVLHTYIIQNSEETTAIYIQREQQNRNHCLFVVNGNVLLISLLFIAEAEDWSPMKERNSEVDPLTL